MYKPRPRIPNKRISELYDFIVGYMERENCPPSIREMGEAIHSNSTSLTNYYLDILISMGKLEKESNISRGIRLPKSFYKDKEIVTLYRCPKYPKCEIHGTTPGDCIQHEISLIKVQYREI